MPDPYEERHDLEYWKAQQKKALDDLKFTDKWYEERMRERQEQQNLMESDG